MFEVFPQVPRQLLQELMQQRLFLFINHNYLPRSVGSLPKYMEKHHLSCGNLRTHRNIYSHMPLANKAYSSSLSGSIR